MPKRLSLLMACTVWASACSSARSTPLSAAAAGVSDGGARSQANARRMSLAWTTTIVALGQGAGTAPVTLLPGGAHALAVRTFATDAAVSGLCYQLEDVVANGDQTWVGTATTDDYGDYCTRCAQRVSVGAGYGFYVLPSAADDAPPLNQVGLRVVLRDCVTLTPLDDAAPRPERLTVEFVSWNPPPSDALVTLPVSVVIATPYAFSPGDNMLSDALAAMRTTWRAAGIDLVISQPVTIDRPTAPVVYSATDDSALSSLSHAAHAAVADADPAWPLVVVAPCLRREDVVTGGRSEPLSTTPHIPGGCGVGDAPDVIFVAGERCAGLTPGPNFIDSGTLGAVLAHELGHFLGLYHVEEVDGRQDGLIDTSPDDQNLMQAMPNAQATLLSNSQILIARRHIAFTTTIAAPP